MELTADEILAAAYAAGFPPPLATTMVAIAIRESGGDPLAFNGVSPDRSYGLWQINMLHNTAYRMKIFGITDEKELFDPTINARAAHVLWGGDNHNINVAWNITLPGYKEKYEAHLPVAQAAALAAMKPVTTS